MKRINLFVLGVFAVFMLNAQEVQEKFELKANVKGGYFFQNNKTKNPSFPSNAFSPGAGISLNYYVLKKTSISLGIGGNFLSPAMNDLWGNELKLPQTPLQVLM